MARKKTQERKRQKRAQQRKQRKQRQRKQRAGARSYRKAPVDPWAEVPGHRPHMRLSLHVPRPERCLPPIQVDPAGHVVDDPRSVLDLPAGPLDEATIRAAWRRALLAHPPEQDPEGARKAREARDLLLDPSAWLARDLGVLRVPDPAAWALGDATLPDGEYLPACSRLLGEAVLYAMLEAAVTKVEPAPSRGEQQALF